jgi:hypothetical protein
VVISDFSVSRFLRLAVIRLFSVNNRTACTPLTVTSTSAYHDPLDKAQLHEYINGVASTLPYPNVITYSNSKIQRFKDYQEIQTLDKGLLFVFS